MIWGKILKVLCCPRIEFWMIIKWKNAVLMKRIVVSFALLRAEFGPWFWKKGLKSRERKDRKKILLAQKSFLSERKKKKDNTKITIFFLD